MISSSFLKECHDRLYLWYKHQGRHHLPWRLTKDPYAIYVSEIMLQQTQVQTVLERFYAPFLERFPSLYSLSNSPLEEVLTLWQGLGYYNRAKNLHKTAQITAPSLPQTIEELLKLPGIGRNTSHAIAAFAYNMAVPVMEANVKRILYRIFAYREATDQQLWEAAFQLLDSRHPFDYNQAMMDLGATICTPKAPLCSHCPFATICQGQPSPESYPSPKPSKQIPTLYKDILMIHSHQKGWLLEKRTGQFLHGLYGFIQTEPNLFPPHLGHISHKAYVGKIQKTYSHFKLMADIYYIEIKEEASLELTENLNHKWYQWELLCQLPLSELERKVISQWLSYRQ